MLHVFIQEIIQNTDTGKEKGKSNLQLRNGNNSNVVVYCVKGGNVWCY